MKVMFLNPPFHARFSREQRSPAVTKSGTLYYPKWLAHAAGVAIREKHEVDFVDAPAWEVGLKYVLDRLEQKGVEALVCDTSTPSIVNDVHVIDQIKAAMPGLQVIMVGRHVSSLPEQTMRSSRNITAIALREYELTVRDWLSAVGCGASLETVEGIVWKKADGELVRNPPRPDLEDLDELPFVSEVYKRFLRIEDYYYGHSLHPLVVFDTSRGCPYKCTFCVYPQTFSGHRMRYRSVGNVADEFEYVAKEMPHCKTVMLEDDTFIVDVKRTEELADELIRRGNQLPYDSNCRADVRADTGFFKKLKRSGARLFCTGFESGDDVVLKHMKKNLRLKEAEVFMERCKQAGIMVHGCFMVGNLNETRETLGKTLDLAKRLRPDTAQFFPIMVYPGTAAYEEAKQKGYLGVQLSVEGEVSHDEFGQWLTPDGLHNSIVNLPNLTHRELVEFCDRARREFYTNPGYVWHKLKQSVKNPNELKRNVKGFRTLAKYLWRGSFGAPTGADAAAPTPAELAAATGGR
jgi:radical SAM superfamily enzyme YgiQ (UPF0313 family)